MSTKLTAVPSEGLLTVSKEFKREALKAVLAIALFILVYLLLFALSMGFVALCLYAGLMIIVTKPGFLTLLLGLGIAGSGIMVFVFLVKFLFSSSRSDESDSIEVFEKDHPRLFASIRLLAQQVGTQMPKKVFICNDVNASVFYHSSFWSMFLPVRKNLRIGLGLVNALNVTELEAVIAHEFGHFSQRSMKVGSWVYQLNRIIFDMLFNNQRFTDGLSSLAKVHGVFYLCALLTIKIIQGIQWVLRQMYKVVNKSYMGLSRQMEYHADLVAASVRGSNNIIHALLRSELASASYETTLGICSKAWEEKKVASEFYFAHRLVLQHTGRSQQLAFVEGLPVISKGEEGGNSRVNFKDQWSSHPTLEERKEYLEPFGLASDADHEPAWVLFQDANALKRELTQVIYRNIPGEEIAEVLNEDQFSAMVKKELDGNSFSPLFRGYYDFRQVDPFDVAAVVGEPFLFTSFEDEFSGETVSLPRKLRIVNSDISVLQAIEAGQIETRSFDFEGRKYKTSEASVVIEQLQEEAKVLEEELKKSDRKLFRYFYAVAPLPEAEGLKQQYITYFKTRADFEAFVDCVNRMMEPMGPVYRGETLGIETIQYTIDKLKGEHEPVFKAALQQWLPCFDSKDKLMASVEKFLEADYQYFSGQSFFDNELQELSTMVHDSWEAISGYHFEQFKSITFQQADIVANREDVMAHSIR